VKWRHTTSPKKKIFKRALSAGTIIATVLWDEKDVILVTFLLIRTTVTLATVLKIYKA
jgi:hypothetical protein